MSINQKPSRAVGGRLALIAIIGGIFLSFAGAATNAANASFVHFVRDALGLSAEIVNVKTEPILISNGGTIATLGVPLTENFDGLLVTPTQTPVAWTDDSTIAGAFASLTTYRAATGASNAGAMYSFGSAGVSDRALGGIASGGTGTFFWAFRLVN
ncbi:MAG: hypothetical protein AB7J13_11045, partial [Pyrinomonadaceae bacterium]